MIPRLGFPALWRSTICLLNSSVKCLGCLGSLIYGPPVSCAPPGTVHIGVANPVSAGTLFTYLGPALARAGPLPSTNNMIEGGANSQPGAVLRNHRGLTSAKRAKAVLWWCHARSGTRGRPAGSPPRCRPTRKSTSCSASAPPRRRARPEGRSGATGPCGGTSTTGARARSGWINGWKRMLYPDTHFVL